ncbi:acyl-CoA reductase [Maribacter cobaltidurans]|uniref:long-chain-fatty-acyl-CoA reductase n=1 Tax=Maribacter cobaltidurans TaxID=1178778 RepID=A0A223VBY1_9FLAO|nr:acyl-CoA reductase [Maribacter cobaltidurans]ASV32777.1 acyl-CoA reductase [Maribacter cobaltidurans]GGD91709.1 acyl-CoA reductase [Maribacter cobaltidurans]
MAQQLETLKAFVKLGEFLGNYCDFPNGNTSFEPDDKVWFQKLDQIVQTAKHHNGWFTKENILYSFNQWSRELTHENIQEWLNKYDLEKKNEKTVAIIMAGNIPLVGFHDFMAVLITGNRALVKLSSNDKLLLPFLAEYLKSIESDLGNQMVFTDEVLTGFDAVIATGSNNTARYFEYYFGNKPNIIRKNRNSVAVLQGNETNQQLQLLGDDIFKYYGLGCRSVSKVFVPRDYNFDILYSEMYAFKDIIDEHKYANNYDYNKAVYLMSEFKFLDNGFLLLKEDEKYASPIASVFYEHYDSTASLLEKIEADSDKIQCVVSSGFMEREIEFGNSQKPSLWDYADGVDTVEFLLKTS